MNSPVPPRFVAMTGVPHDIASRAARPNDSCRDGSSITSPAARIGATCSTWPRHCTRSATPSRAASSRATGSSGPSPIRSSRDGRRAATRAKTSTTAGTFLTGRKLEAWISSFSSGAAKRPRRRSSCRGRNRRVSTKFGMTSIGQSTPKTRTVSSRRKALTAVTASLRWITNRVIGRNDGSWPTSVTSVPCRVVMIFTRPPSISRARKALAACGMA